MTQPPRAGQGHRGIDHEFQALAWRAIEATNVPVLLAGHDAVALERIAFGGGATRWYFVKAPDQLRGLVERLLPGSVLSLYFDGRIAVGPVSSEVKEEILKIVAEDRDAVVGWLRPDGLEIAMDFVAGRSELDDFLTSLAAGESLFYGRFPARDNDGVSAVTVVLPDRDGVTRAHPH